MKRQPVLKDPLARKAWAAMQAAVAKVVEAHRRDGRPLAVWQDGKAVLVPPDGASIVGEASGKYRVSGRSRKA
ncbi:MAG: hypothetical protein ABSG14_01965 [Verrucomicrobiia bacterium]|jgi:hypothetical protein